MLINLNLRGSYKTSKHLEENNALDQRGATSSEILKNLELRKALRCFLHKTKKTCRLIVWLLPCMIYRFPDNTVNALTQKFALKNIKLAPIIRLCYELGEGTL